MNPNCLKVAYSIVRNRLKDRKNYLLNRDKLKPRAYAHTRKFRNEVMKCLGEICASCGFSDLRALQIDHINGGGTSEIKRLGNGVKYYRHIMSNISNYQILCANCNQIKRITNQEDYKRTNHD